MPEELAVPHREGYSCAITRVSLPGYRCVKPRPTACAVPTSSYWFDRTGVVLAGPSLARCGPSSRPLLPPPPPPGLPLCSLHRRNCSARRRFARGVRHATLRCALLGHMAATASMRNRCRACQAHYARTLRSQHKAALMRKSRQLQEELQQDLEYEPVLVTSVSTALSPPFALRGVTRQDVTSARCG